MPGRGSSHRPGQLTPRMTEVLGFIAQKGGRLKFVRGGYWIAGPSYAARIQGDDVDSVIEALKSEGMLTPSWQKPEQRAREQLKRPLRLTETARALFRQPLPSELRGSPTGRLPEPLPDYILPASQAESRVQRAGRGPGPVMILDFADIEKRVLAHAVAQPGKGDSYVDLLAVWLAQESPLVVDAERFAKWLDAQRGEFAGTGRIGAVQQGSTESDPTVQQGSTESDAAYAAVADRVVGPWAGSGTAWEKGLKERIVAELQNVEAHYEAKIAEMALQHKEGMTRER